MFLVFERFFDNELRDSPMIGIDPHYAELIANPAWPSRGKERRYVPSKLAAIEKDITDGLALGKYRLSTELQRTVFRRAKAGESHGI
jgi:hypothetical protein